MVSMCVLSSIRNATVDVKPFQDSKPICSETQGDATFTLGFYDVLSGLACGVTIRRCGCHRFAITSSRRENALIEV